MKHLPHSNKEQIKRYRQYSIDPTVKKIIDLEGDTEYIDNACLVDSEGKINEKLTAIFKNDPATRKKFNEEAAKLFYSIITESEDCNDPTLCSLCDRQKEWPKCMKDVEFRGYHSVFKEHNTDDVVKCDNFTDVKEDRHE